MAPLVAMQTKVGNGLKKVPAAEVAAHQKRGFVKFHDLDLAGKAKWRALAEHKDSAGNLAPILDKSYFPLISEPKKAASISAVSTTTAGTASPNAK